MIIFNTKFITLIFFSGNQILSKRIIWEYFRHLTMNKFTLIDNCY